MAGFDQGNVFHSVGLTNDVEINSIKEYSKNRFFEFIQTFKTGGFNFIYRDILKNNYKIKKYFLPINLQDLITFDEKLANEVITKPNEYLCILEEVVNGIADGFRKEIETAPDVFPDIQILLQWDAKSASLRDIRSNNVSQLIKITGIVVAASSNKLKAIKLTLQCQSCNQYLPNQFVKRGLNGYVIPRKCNAAAMGVRQGAGGAIRSCPIDPYFIVPDKCQCINYQTIKLQESPENVPHGEMPRTLQLYCDGYLCNKAVPGNRITVVGIYSTMQNPATKKEKNQAGVCPPYILSMGIDIENTGSTRSGISSFSVSDGEEQAFRAFASNPDIYDIIARSIAPGIFGSDDIKKAIACLLFGGSRKRMSDGLFRRGDINMLMLGDPGTAKSQLLKFVEQVAPIAVYTSGKGSSAAGLTASITRDPSSRNFILEGGAMVLADGGVVCIDEFDKMREDDRVAIHEAMEQQTISIAKAGITTMLNSRCSVLAAANSVYGHWDDTKEAGDNIDFMPTILSRFDMIFLVKDLFDERRDMQIASHVMNVHINDGNVPEVNSQQTESLNMVGEDGIVSMLKLKKYIAYCRERCGSRITDTAVQRLVNQYVLMRSGASESEKDSGKKSSIPITIRQLEALVRITESLAKMRLSSFANEADVEEAIRLFQVSTLSAALSGSLEGVEGFTSQEEHDVLVKLEKDIKKRFAIGSQVSEQTIIQDFTSKGYAERIIIKVLQIMIRRNEIQPKIQRKLLLRIK